MGLAATTMAWILPGRCPVCEAPGPAPCTGCWRLLRPVALGGPSPPGVDRSASLLRYEGAGRELLARLKYRNARATVPWLAGGMAELARVLVEAGSLEVVTWPPTSAERRLRRGFDQAEVLARAVAAELGLPCRPLLVRRPGLAQTGLGREARRQGPVFVARRGPPARRVLVVDDVVTSGGTLASAARALRTGGGEVVMAVTAGRTPLKVHGPSADP